MITWSLFSHQKVTPPSPVDSIPFEPLWYNSYVTNNSNIITDIVIQHFISFGITQVKHLCEMKSYEPQFRSEDFWIFETRNNRNIFTTTVEWCITHLLTLGKDAAIKHVTDIEISCDKSKLVSFRNPPNNGFYMLAFDYWFSYDDHEPRVWCDILNFEVDRKVYFNNILVVC